MYEKTKAAIASYYVRAAQPYTAANWKWYDREVSDLDYSVREAYWLEHNGTSASEHDKLSVAEIAGRVYEIEKNIAKGINPFSTPAQ